MDKTGYICKMNDLLSDASVYRKVTKGEGKMEAARFKKKARDVLLRSAKGCFTFWRRPPATHP